MKKININATNFYLLDCKGGYLLIDAGWVGKYKTFNESLKKIAVDIRSIKFILITHHHHDHTALIQDIRNESKCRILAYESQVDYIKRGITNIRSVKQYNIGLKILDKLLSPFIQYKYNPISLNESDILIKDEFHDIYDLTGIKGKIVYTPGHSKDSISLLLENGDAFVGDVAMNILKIFGQKYRPVEVEDYSEVYKSWGKLINSGAKTIYPSHGNPFCVEKLEEILKSL